MSDITIINDDTLGFVNIRNEDGTQWWVGGGQWGDSRGKRAITHLEFRVLQQKAAKTQQNNSPDNGYFGLMNLKFYACSPTEAQEQEAKADKFQMEQAGDEYKYDIEVLADLVMSLIGESEQIDAALNKFMEDNGFDMDTDEAMTESELDRFALLQAVFWRNLLATAITRL